MKLASTATAFALLVALAFQARAGEAPYALIEGAVSDVLAAYEEGKDRLGTDPDFLRGIIEKHILPHVDFVLMSKLVLGKHWRKATESQREDFTGAFREHLIRTYSTPLSEYDGQKINFLPFREGKDPSRATVNTEIVPHEGVPIPVTYRMRLGDDGMWKIYDLSIDAVSMVGNYRSAYAKEISREGLDAFIAGLVEKTQRSGADTTR